MSLSSALANALTGLTSNARAAGVVSSNLANLYTPGYGRRDVELSPISRGASGGVRVLGVTRYMDQGLLADRRGADGALGHAKTTATFFKRLEQVIGTPEAAGSLSARIAAFDAALTTAASRPEAPERLSEVVARAREVIGSLNGAARDIQARRQAAEGDISQAVQTLNTSLKQVERLNFDIQEARLRGQDVSSLQDQRQVVIDRIAEIVPVREVPRDLGTVGLVTTGGAVLLDRVAVDLSFERANVIVADMTLANGSLNGLDINGQIVPTSGGSTPMQGGRLAALFDLRDAQTVDAQAQLDALTRNLVERFQDAGLDATRGAGDPGLFTDGGAAFAAVDEVGLSERIALNVLVDPQAGGATWRLRDGLGAAVPGPEGDATLILAYGDALRQPRVLASGGIASGAASLAGHASTMISQFGQLRLTEEQNVTFASARRNELENMLLQDGVDSDVETQRLLQIEQAFSANARLIQTVDEMMNALLRI